MLEIAELIKEKKITMNSESYSTLISAYAALREPQQALLVFGQMERSGLEKTSHAQHALLDAFGKAGDINSMENLFQKMKAPMVSIFTYSTLLNAYSKVVNDRIRIDCFTLKIFYSSPKISPLLPLYLDLPIGFHANASGFQLM